MGKDSKIEWCHHTVNLWWGCAKVSAACAHCYAETLAKLFSQGKATWGPGGARWIRWKRALEEVEDLHAAALKRGVRERVFVNSMSDTFEDRADLDEARLAFFVEVTRFPNLDFLLLTKRPENVERMVPMSWLSGEWPANVWWGVTVENQDTADKRIPILLRSSAPVKFLSCEPLLGGVDLLGVTHLAMRPFGCDDGINWVIVGGESGGGARPMHPAWARILRDQCATAGVPFFFKQWGEWVDADSGPSDDSAYANKAECWLSIDGEQRDGALGVDFFGSDYPLYRVGKKAAGRLLDGVEHSAFPEVAA